MQLDLLRKNMGLDLIKQGNCKNVLGQQMKKRGKTLFFSLIKAANLHFIKIFGIIKERNLIKSL